MIKIKRGRRIGGSERIKIIIFLLLISLSLSFQSMPISAEEKPVVITWQEAGKHYNELVKVTGEVISVHKTKKFYFLNFDADYKNSFTIVIPSRVFDKFPATTEALYKNKKIIVYGKVVEFNNKPEIVVDEPTQIEFLANNK